MTNRAYPVPGYPLHLPPYRVSAGTTTFVTIDGDARRGRPISYKDFRTAAIAGTPDLLGVLFDRPVYYGGFVISQPKRDPAVGTEVRPPPRACMITGASPALMQAVEDQLGKALAAKNVWCADLFPLPETTTTDIGDSVSAPFVPPDPAPDDGSPPGPDAPFVAVDSGTVGVVEPDKWVGREMLYIKLLTEAVVTNPFAQVGAVAVTGGVVEFRLVVQKKPGPTQGKFILVRYAIALAGKRNAANDAAITATFLSGMFYESAFRVGVLREPLLTTPDFADSYTAAGLASFADAQRAIRASNDAASSAMAAAGGTRAVVIPVHQGSSTDGTAGGIDALPTVAGWIKEFFGV